MNSIKKIIAGVVISLAVQQNYSMNWLRPYDSLLQSFYRNTNCYYIEMFHEWGVGPARGYDSDANHTNVLQIWNKDQNVITMLQGFDPDSLIGQTYESLHVTDNGQRGHLCFHGVLRSPYQGALHSACLLPYGFSLDVYLPWIVMELKDVCWQDQTQDITEEDIRLKEQLTNNLCQEVFRLGHGLDLGGWRRTGLSDVTIMAQWIKSFVQHRPLLKQVQLRARLAVVVPTGKKKDEDKLFAVPFGYDGSTGILYGGGLRVDLGYYCNIGFDVELLHLFGNTRNRRIKTDPCQTELLLLAKTCAYKDWGLTQRFNLFVEANQLCDHWSFLVGYQYFKHGDDVLSLIGQEFSNNIANTAKSLQEWTMHHIVMKFTYDVSTVDQSIDYSGSVYTRIPVHGQRTALVPMFGIRAAAAF